MTTVGREIQLALIAEQHCFTKATSDLIRRTKHLVYKSTLTNGFLPHASHEHYGS